MFNVVSFMEYMAVQNAPNMDEPEQKLRWLFQTFDKG